MAGGRFLFNLSVLFNFGTESEMSIFSSQSQDKTKFGGGTRESSELL